MVQSTTRGVAAAEALAADSVASPEFDETTDGDVMHAVVAACARRDAAITAEERARAALEVATAALEPIAR